MGGGGGRGGSICPGQPSPDETVPIIKSPYTLLSTGF